jgi:putative CocE/NonD family hydrolase
MRNSALLLMTALILATQIAGRVSPALATTPGAPESAPVYTWHDVEIPMRDGVKLHTSIGAPRDAAKDDPILLSRTPYGADSRAEKPLNPLFAKAGYIFVWQDVRGRYGSGGQFLGMTPQRAPGSTGVDESTDTYDTIDWLVKNLPHNNGRVGLTGISFGGFYAAAGAIDAHPALKAVSPQAPQMDWFIGDDVHHNGAFFLSSYFGFAALCEKAEQPMVCAQHFRVGASDGYKFFLGMGPLPEFDRKYFHGEYPGWTQTMAHGAYDSYWQTRALTPHLKNIRPAILAVGGWYDANDMYGSLHAAGAIRQQSPETPLALVMGPWYHAQWSFDHEDDGHHIDALDFGAPTSTWFQEHIEFPFFEHWLRDGPDPKLPAVTAFDTGAKAWSEFTAWPPKASSKSTLYFAPGKTLSFEPPRAANAGFDSWVSDPAKPVPSTARITMDMDSDYMAEDQHFADARPDVLVYESAPLAADVTVAGVVEPHLSVSTTGTDSDFVVKLIDVHPDTDAKPMAGFEELVRGDVMRAKFRNSLETPEPMVAGKVTDISFAMQDAFHTFKKGHRIMVQIASSWFPLVDRNPQSFVDIYKASAADFQAATQHLYIGGATASRLDLPILRALP